MFEVEPIPAELGLDMFVCRTRGEIPYANAVAAFPQSAIDAWAGIGGVRQVAILQARSLLRKMIDDPLNPMDSSMELAMTGTGTSSVWKAAPKRKLVTQGNTWHEEE